MREREQDERLAVEAGAVVGDAAALELPDAGDPVAPDEHEVGRHVGARSPTARTAVEYGIVASWTSPRSSATTAFATPPSSRIRKRIPDRCSRRAKAIRSATSPVP